MIASLENSIESVQQEESCIKSVDIKERNVNDTKSDLESQHSESDCSLNQPILEVTPDMIAKSMQTFHPKGPGQIGFEKEDSLIIINWNYADGWAHVASVDGKRVGIFPQALIQRLVTSIE